MEETTGNKKHIHCNALPVVKKCSKKCIVYWAPLRNKNNDPVGIYKQKTGGNATEPMKGKTVRSTSLFLLYRGQSVQETVNCTGNNKGNNKHNFNCDLF